MVLAREQQLHALDGLAAAAAHELGTPLSTIAVVAKELAREAPKDGNFAEDIALLQSQAERCREILSKLTRGPAGARSAACAHQRQGADRRGGRSPIAASTPRSSSAPPPSSDAEAGDGARRRAQARRHLRPRQPGRERRRLRAPARGDHGHLVRPRRRDHDCRRRTGHPAAGARRAGRALHHHPAVAATAARARTVNHRAWGWASSSPRPCWSGLAPRSYWKTGEQPATGPSPRSPGGARYSRPAQWPPRAWPEVLSEAFATGPNGKVG